MKLIEGFIRHTVLLRRNRFPSCACWDKDSWPIKFPIVEIHIFSLMLLYIQFCFFNALILSWIVKVFEKCLWEFWSSFCTLNELKWTTCVFIQHHWLQVNFYQRPILKSYHMLSQSVAHDKHACNHCYCFKFPDCGTNERHISCML